MEKNNLDINPQRFLINFVGCFITVIVMLVFLARIFHTRADIGLGGLILLLAFSYWYARHQENLRSEIDTLKRNKDSKKNMEKKSASVEKSTGIVLRQHSEEGPKVLLIRVRKDVYEIPKGHVELGETLQFAALRELKEETNLLSDVAIVQKLGKLSYTFKKQSGGVVEKQVTYFLGEPETTPVEFGKLPSRTRELLWVTDEELESLPMVSEELKNIVRGALK